MTWFPFTMSSSNHLQTSCWCNSCSFYRKGEKTANLILIITNTSWQHQAQHIGYLCCYSFPLVSFYLGSILCSRDSFLLNRSSFPWQVRPSFSGLFGLHQNLDELPDLPNEPDWNRCTVSVKGSQVSSEHECPVGVRDLRTHSHTFIHLKDTHVQSTVNLILWVNKCNCAEKSLKDGCPGDEKAFWMCLCFLALCFFCFYLC